MTAPATGGPAAPPRPVADARQLQAAARSLGDIPQYLPFSRRRRLLLVVLAVLTAVMLVWTLLDPPGGVQRPRALGAPMPPSVAPQRLCAPGQTQDCLGGHIRVLPAPAPRAASPASAPGR